MRRKREVRSNPVRIPSQRELLRDVMLSAAQCDAWLTLRELARLTQYGEASISAQLRHLRKLRYGAFVVDKQVREESDVYRAIDRRRVWDPGSPLHLRNATVPHDWHIYSSGRVGLSLKVRHDQKLDYISRTYRFLTEPRLVTPGQAGVFVK